MTLHKFKLLDRVKFSIHAVVEGVTLKGEKTGIINAISIDQFEDGTYIVNYSVIDNLYPRGHQRTIHEQYLELVEASDHEAEAKKLAELKKHKEE